MPELRADLVLNMDDAMSSLSDLGSALDSVASNFGAALADAVTQSATAAGSVDLPTPTTGASTTVTVDDSQAVGALDALDQAVQDTDAQMAGLGDAGTAGLNQVAAAGETAVAGVDAAASATDTLNTSLADTAGQADTTAGALDTVGSSASTAGSAAADAGGGFDAAGAAQQGLASLSGLSKGSLENFAGSAEAAGGSAAAAGVTVAAAAATLGGFAQQGIAALGATERFNTSLGDMADRVRNVNVGNLHENMDKLAVSMGSSSSAVEQGATTLFNFQIAAGTSRTAAANYTDQVTALAARAIAANPSLGSMDDVMNRLNRTFSTGRTTGLAPYGIALDKVQVSTVAAQIAANNHDSSVTAQDRALAAAQITAQKYGTTMAATADQLKNPILQEASLKASVEDTLATMAKPLAAPFLDTLRQTEPVATAAGSALSALASGVLPAIGTAMTVLSPVISAVADALNFLAPVIGPVVEGFLAFEAASAISTVLTVVGSAMQGLANIAPVMGDAILVAGEDVQIAGASVESAIPIIGPLVAVLGIAASAFGLFGGDATSATPPVDNFKNAVKQANDALNDTTSKALQTSIAQSGLVNATNRSGISFQQLQAAIFSVSGAHTQEIASLNSTVNAWGNAGAVVSAYKAQLGGVGPTVGDVAAAHRTLATSAATVVAEFTKLSPELGRAAQQMREHGNLTADSAAKLLQLATDQAQAAETARALASSTGLSNTATVQAAQAYTAAQQAAKAYKTAQDALNNGALSLFDAQTKVGESTQSLAAALIANGNSFEVNTAEGDKNRQAVSAAAAAIPAYGQALVASGQSAAQATQAQQFLTQALVNELTPAFGGSASAAAAFVATLLPTGGAAAAAVPGLDSAAGAYNSVGTAASNAIPLVNAATTSVSKTGAIAAAAGIDVQAFPAGLSKAAAEAGTQAQRIAENMRTGLTPVTPYTVNILNTQLAAFNSGMAALGPAATTGGTNTGTAYGTALLPGIQSGNQTASQAATLGAANLGADAAPAARDAGITVGQAFDSGFANGINQNVSVVTGSAADVGSRALAAAKAAIAAGSPSRRAYEEIGLPFVQGIALGITENAGLVESAVTGAMNSALAGAAAPGVGLAAPGPGGATVGIDPTAVVAIGDAVAKAIRGQAPGAAGQVVVVPVSTTGEALAMLPPSVRPAAAAAMYGRS